MPARMSSVVGSVPVPDPTTLTTEALRRDISALRELLESRMIGIEQAFTRLRVDLDKVPPTIDREVHNLKELHAQATESAQRATASALQAAKEAFFEHKETTRATLASLSTLINTKDDAMQSKVDNLREAIAENRNNINESRGSRTGGADSLRMMALWVGLVVSMGMALFGIIHEVQQAPVVISSPAPR